MRAELEALLQARFDGALVSPLLDALEALQQAYAEGRLRPSELEGGHFAEYCFRLCEKEAFGKYTAVGRPLTRIDQLVVKLASAPSGHDSFRLHIPRVLFGIAEVRNRRGVGHPSGDVNPNYPDAELVRTTAAWCTAELLRHAAGLDITSAQALVDELARRVIPFIEEIEGRVLFLEVGLSVRDRVLLLLHHYGVAVLRAQLAANLPGVSGSRFRTVLSELRGLACIHETTQGWVLSRKGLAETEELLRARLSPNPTPR